MIQRSSSVSSESIQVNVHEAYLGQKDPVAAVENIRAVPESKMGAASADRR